jgi:hypothetical protein
MIYPGSKLSKLSSKIPDFIINQELLSQQEKTSLIEEFKASNSKIAQEYLGWNNKELFDSFSTNYVNN